MNVDLDNFVNYTIFLHNCMKPIGMSSQVKSSIFIQFSNFLTIDTLIEYHYINMNYIIRELRDPDSYNSCLTQGPEKRKKKKNNIYKGILNGDS